MNSNSGKLSILKTKASSLYTTYCNCLDALKKRETDFQRLEMATHPDHLAKWTAMDETPGKVGKKVVSVHVAQYKKDISFSEILNDTHMNFTCSRTTNTRKGLQSTFSSRDGG
jgi:hypothetical protein